MDRQYTPDEIAQLPESPRNRGLVQALKRFGDPASQTAARQWLGRLERDAATTTPQDAA